MMPRPIPILALLGFALALRSGAHADPAPGDRFEHDMMVRFHMHENFGVLRVMERGLIHGKIDEAHDLADAIARAPDEPGTGAWVVQIKRVRERAAALAKTTSVNEALRDEAWLAAACGSCHVDSGAQPEFSARPAVPADRGTIESRMARHLWASDRLWEAMLGNADAPWRAGLDVLAATPLPASELGSDRVALGKQLQSQASDARAQRSTLDLSGRAAAYGEILVTCAACHAKKPANDASR